MIAYSGEWMVEAATMESSASGRGATTKDAWQFRKKDGGTRWHTAG